MGRVGREEQGQGQGLGLSGACAGGSFVCAETARCVKFLCFAARCVKFLCFTARCLKFLCFRAIGKQQGKARG